MIVVISNRYVSGIIADFVPAVLVFDRNSNDEQGGD